VIEERGGKDLPHVLLKNISLMVELRKELVETSNGGVEATLVLFDERSAV